MADEPSTNPAGNDPAAQTTIDPKGGTTPPVTPPAKTYTEEELQAKINDVVQKRLKDTKSLKEYNELKAELDRSRMTEEERIKAEIEARHKELEERATQAENALKLSFARELLAKHGLDPEDAEAMVGATNEDTEKRVLRQKAIIDKNVKTALDGQLKKGAPGTGSQNPGSGSTTLSPERLKAVGYSPAQIDQILKK